MRPRGAMSPILKSLGDQALLAYLPDEAAAVGFAAAIRAAGFAWLVDVVPAYATVGIYFDPERIGLDGVREALAKMRSTSAEVVGRTHVIPCCYEMQLDLGRVAEHTGLT